MTTRDKEEKAIHKPGCSHIIKMLEVQDQIVSNGILTINEVGTWMFSNVFFSFNKKNHSQFPVCPDFFLDAQFSKTLQKPMTAQIKLPIRGANIKY